MPSRGHLGTPTLPSHPSGATATSTLLGSYARAVTLGLVTCLLVPNLARAQGGYEGDYLNLSLPGDGTTPDAHAMAEQQREALKGPRAAATASSQGDASYSLGFDLPPALLLPEIGLSYSSATGRHSVVARGWSLNAGMSIERIRGRELLGAYSDLLGSSELLVPVPRSSLPG